MRLFASVVLAIGSITCQDASPEADAPTSPGCPAPEALLASTNPIDHAMISRFAGACLDPVAEDPQIFCRRLHLDLIGRTPTGAEADRCATATIEQTLRTLQAEPRYLLVAERFWRDAFRLSPETDWRYLDRLFDGVDELHQGELAYGAWVESVLSDPAWALAGGHTDRAFSVFLGRSPTTFEARAFDPLFAMWFASYRVSGPNNLPVAELGASLDPYACLAIGGCRSELFGGGEVDLGELPVDPRGAPRALAYESLNTAQLEALLVPGRMLSDEAGVWEAAADRILDRFLAYEDPEAPDQSAGAIVPEVRAVLAQALASTGSYPAAERLVLSSWLYRQRRDAEPGRPIWAVGPWKRMTNESLIDALLRGAGVDLGACEPRYPMRRYQRELLQKRAIGGLDLTELESAFAQIAILLEPRTPYRTSVRGIIEPDLRYEDLADLVGGCTTTQPEAGVSTALSHEALIEALCAAELSPPPDRSIGEGPEVIHALLEEAVLQDLGRRPTSTEVEGVTRALLGPCPECAGRPLATAICRTVAGSAEMLFY